METLIAYGSKHGATEKAARILAEKIEGATTLVNLKDSSKSSLDLTKFDAVAVGGSIYMGSIQKEVQEFCKENEEILLTKKLGVFICCGNEEQAETQLAASFSEKILEKARAKGYFGYVFDFEKLNFISKFVVKKVSKIEKSRFRINEDRIHIFAKEIKE